VSFVVFLILRLAIPSSHIVWNSCGWVILSVDHPDRVEGLMVNS